MKPRSIATRTGDDGTTSLLYGQRVPKDHPQVEAVGALDELNAAIGLAKASRPPGGDAGELESIQQELVALMGEVSCAESDTARHAASKFVRIGDTALARVDAAVATMESHQPKFDGWATPGANPHAAALDLETETQGDGRKLRERGEHDAEAEPRARRVATARVSRIARCAAPEHRAAADRGATAEPERSERATEAR